MKKIAIEIGEVGDVSFKKKNLKDLNRNLSKKQKSLFKKLQDLENAVEEKRESEAELSALQTTNQQILSEIEQMEGRIVSLTKELIGGENHGIGE
jgi:chromosome segregation ATPase